MKKLYTENILMFGVTIFTFSLPHIILTDSIQYRNKLSDGDKNFHVELSAVGMT
jgi:hypothetical protein